MKAVKLVRFEVLMVVKMTMLFLWVVTPASALKMERLFFSEKSGGLSTYESTRRYNPGE
jgi:hypothetical protein